MTTSGTTAARPRLRGVLHHVAYTLSLVSGTALVILARGCLATVAAAVYAASATLLLGTSAAYHRGSWSPRAREVMERLDHSMIFVLVAGTTTPFVLLALDGAARGVALGVVWAGAAAGVVARNVLPRRPRWLFPLLHAALGCTGVVVVPALVRDGGPTVPVLLLVGALTYAAGAVVYVRRRPDPSPRWFGFHEVFHALTLLASVPHAWAVGLVVTRSPAG